MDSKERAGLTAIQTRLLEKLEERNRIDLLLKNSRTLAQHFDSLADATDSLAQGGQTVDSVLENWQNVFRTIHIALGTLPSAENASNDEEVALPERLVRIPVRNDDDDLANTTPVHNS